MTDTFTCPFCHLRFGLRAEFQDHLQVEHPERYRRGAEGEPSETEQGRG